MACNGCNKFANLKLIKLKMMTKGNNFILYSFLHRKELAVCGQL